MISLLVAVLIAVSALTGCNKMPVVDKSIKPEEHFSQYKTLTDLYGTPWRDTLQKLNIDLQELDTEGLNYVGVPLQESYAGLEFDTALRFGGDDNHLRGVEYSVSYQYPEDEVKLLQDMVKINRELISDFGKASDTSLVFNWVEKRLGEEWNRDIAYWQDVQVLKRLLDAGYDGTLLYWNLSSVDSDNIKNVHTEHGLSAGISIRGEEGIAVITINY